MIGARSRLALENMGRFLVASMTAIVGLRLLGLDEAGPSAPISLISIAEMLPGAIAVAVLLASVPVAGTRLRRMFVSVAVSVAITGVATIGVIALLSGQGLDILSGPDRDAFFGMLFLSAWAGLWYRTVALVPDSPLVQDATAKGTRGRH